MGQYLDFADFNKDPGLNERLKLEFAEQNLKEISKDDFKALKFEPLKYDNKVAVVRVYNGPGRFSATAFSAMLVCSPANELEYTQDSLQDDCRPMRFYLGDWSQVMGVLRAQHPRRG